MSPGTFNRLAEMTPAERRRWFRRMRAEQAAKRLKAEPIRLPTDHPNLAVIRGWLWHRGQF